ncbi:hypothetical protein BDQ17DRAFT_1428879 [Cyathus striatus]|nr:hypothetical protein BDQ17DRAFT_1428879 [Cyathus striatus]
MDNMKTPSRESSTSLVGRRVYEHVFLTCEVVEQRKMVRETARRRMCGGCILSVSSAIKLSICIRTRVMLFLALGFVMLGFGIRELALLPVLVTNGSPQAVALYEESIIYPPSWTVHCAAYKKHFHALAKCTGPKLRTLNIDVLGEYEVEVRDCGLLLGSRELLSVYVADCLASGLLFELLLIRERLRWYWYCSDLRLRGNAKGSSFEVRIVGLFFWPNVGFSSPIDNRGDNEVLFKCLTPGLSIRYWSLNSSYGVERRGSVWRAYAMAWILRLFNVGLKWS